MMRLFTLLLIAGLAGCGRGPAFPHATISGTVSVDGKPVENGTITYFSDAAAAPHTGTANIEQGAFRLQDVPLGATVFTFSASAETGKMIPGPGGVPEPQRVNLIPKKYSTEGMARDISGDSVQDFEMESASIAAHANRPE